MFIFKITFTPWLFSFPNVSFLNNSIFDKVKGLLGHEKATLIDLYFFLLKQSLSHFKNKDKGLGRAYSWEVKQLPIMQEPLGLILSAVKIKRCQLAILSINSIHYMLCQRKLLIPTLSIFTHHLFNTETLRGIHY